MAPTALSSGPSVAESPFSTSSQAQPASSSSSNLFSSSKSNGTRATAKGTNGHMEVDEDASEELDIAYLEPSAYSSEGQAKWKNTGRTINIAVSPAGGEIATWVSKKPSSDPNSAASVDSPTLNAPDKVVYLASPYSFPNPLLEFFAETYTIFSSLQTIVAAGFKLPSPSRYGGAVVERMLGPPSAETIGHMSRIALVYLEELAKLRETAELDDDLRTKYGAVHHIVHLVQILFLPRDGRGEGLLGEEMLDWVNGVDPAPDNRQGNEILQTNPPWEHPAFWPYISRCILRGLHTSAATFLRALEKHSHEPISKFASLLASHLSSLPRSHDTTAYPLDHQFLSAHKKWSTNFQAEIAVLTGGKKGNWFGEDGGRWTKWEEDFRTVVELMEGKAERVLEESSDWREALGAWGIMVDVGLKRDDLPAVTHRILDKVPVDSTVLDDSIQSALCTGDIVKALVTCHDLDIWLSAHLADIFDKLALIPDEDRFDMSLRDYFLLEYTDLLAGHPKHSSLWRIVVDYLQAAGEEGRCRLKEYIMHVGLDLSPPEPTLANGDADGMEDDAMDVEDDVDPKFRHIRDLREICASLRLDDEYLVISQVLAEKMIRTGEFGIAATIYASSGDTDGLSRLADRVLDTYISTGEDEFIHQISTLPPSLLYDVANDIDEDGQLENDSPLRPAHYTARMAFLAQFRDFVLFRRQDAVDRAAEKVVSLISTDMAPVSLRSVLLVESIRSLEASDVVVSSANTFEIMRVLEDVVDSAQYAPREYLSQLEIFLSRQAGSMANGVTSDKEDYAGAWRKLEEVRLALARNLARSLVLNVHDQF